MSILLFFVDGLGLGPHHPEFNPLTRSKKDILRLFLNIERPPLPFKGLYKGVDACLEIAGLPQSATGQTAIFTGINAAQMLGYHLNGFPNQKLRDILWEYSILKILKERGYRTDFLNTYRPSFFDLSKEDQIRKGSCSTIAALAAEIPLHTREDLVKEKSICHDLTNQTFRDHGFEVPLFTPEQSGRIAAQAGEETEFLLMEYFLTDLIGHAQNREQAALEIEKLEIFLEALLSDLNHQTSTLLLISDHGNFEDLSTRSHTKNPALFMAWGEHAGLFMKNCHRLQDLYPILLEQMPPRHKTPVK
jgi:2,3-bisphosphoglycerate-independent phosphoglycerate mutase